MESGTHVKGWDKCKSEQQTGQDGEKELLLRYKSDHSCLLRSVKF